MTAAVVIPFYQREDGVLRRTLESVFAQSFQDFSVIVVDDASPHSAEDELAPLPSEQRERIHIVSQINKGPGGARNTGLDATPADMECVAFLDSDDIWDHFHLERAVSALQKHGGDLYFANIGGDEGFEYQSTIAEMEDKWPSSRLSNVPIVYEVDALHEHILADWSSLHLSSTVMGPRVFKNVRFDESLRLAGEDLLFFFDCIRQADRTLLCAEAGSVRGLGSNLFHGASNVSDKYIDQQRNFLRMFQLMQKRPGAGTSSLTPILKGRREEARLKLLWGQRDRIKGGQGAQLSKVFALLGQDPAYPFWLAGYVLRRAMNRGGASEAANTSA